MYNFVEIRKNEKYSIRAARVTAVGGRASLQNEGAVGVVEEVDLA